MGGGSGLIGAITKPFFGDGGASAQADAANNSIAASREATSNSLALQKYMYDDTKKLNKPMYDLGLSATQQAFGGKDANGNFVFDPNKLNQYSTNKAFEYQDFAAPTVTDDPGYQFRLQQGVNALDMSAAAKGNLLSGAQQKEVSQYGQDLASQEYNNAFAHSLAKHQQNQGNALTEYNSDVALGTNRYNQLASVLGMGQTSTNALSQNNANYANTATATTMQNANNIASAESYKGNALAAGARYGTDMALKGVTAGSAAYAASDKRLKDNVQKIGVVGPLNLYSWDWNETAIRLGLNNNTPIGFIAQEVAGVFPHAVCKIGEYYAVNYQQALKLAEGK